VTTDDPQLSSPHPALRILTRKNVLAGLMFIAVAALGLWLSRSYPVGTALRMGTGYMPRLLCWILMGLGAIVLVQGLRQADGGASKINASDIDTPPTGALAQLWPIVVVTASLVAFGLSIERLGLVVSILLLIGIGSLAARGLKVWEALAAALGLIVIAWAIFIFGLGLTIPVWPDF
jgi:putative tricarboxylic transport membrane protein